MFSDSGIPRVLIIYAICLPIAIVLGYLLGTANTFFNFAVIGLFVFTLAMPLVASWYHWILIFSINSTILVFFLPGKPELAAVVAAFAVGAAVLNRTLKAESQFIWIPHVVWPLIFLAIVVTVTAHFTGGFGGRVFGSSLWGAKRYLGVYGAIFALFGLVSQTIPKNKARLAASVFILAGLTSVVSNIAYTLGPSFYFLFNFFPSDLASHQYRATGGEMVRLTGLSFAAMDAAFFVLLWYGVRGLFEINKPWRLLTFIAMIGLSLLGGFRSVLILSVLVFVSQLYLEGVHRSRYMPILLVVGLLGGGFTLVFLDDMPKTVQRSLSFLPVEIDRAAAQDAAASLNWRLEMWRVVLPEVPEHLLLGKGYTFDGTEYYLTTIGMDRGIYPSYEHTLVSGNYHQGILTIIVPFGIWGLIAFIWFSAAGWWVLLRNKRYGDPDLYKINTFLLAYFVGRLIFYTIFYGQFDLEFIQLTGTVGLSIAINHGVCSPRSEQARQSEETEQVEAGAQHAPLLPLRA